LPSLLTDIGGEHGGVIWIYCGWLHTEPQLKWIDTIFWAFMGLALCVFSGGRNLLWCDPMYRLAD
jgi:hypothetical protein